jgi:Acyl-CoA oxidase
MSLYHLQYYTIWSAKRFLLEKAGVKCPNLLAHLKKLVVHFALQELAKDSAVLYDCGYFTSGRGAEIQDSIKRLTDELRPQFIPLVEAFDIPDYVLNSAIGNSYGDIYEEYMNQAKNSRLNRDGQDVVPDYLKRTMFPAIIT